MDRGTTKNGWKMLGKCWENVEKSWNNQSFFGGKCEWKTKDLAEKMELSDCPWEIWRSEKKSRRQNFWEKLSGDIYPKMVDALIFWGIQPV